MNTQPVSTGPQVTVAARFGKATSAGRRSPAPRPALAAAAVVVAGVGLGATAALTITAETSGQ